MVAVALQTAVADEVILDWTTLTDFTADFEVSVSNLGESVGMEHLSGRLKAAALAKVAAHGTISADVPNERMRAHVTITADPQAAGAHVEETFDITFDGPKGYVAAREVASAMTPAGLFKAEGCAKVTFPQGLLPPPAFVQSQLESAEPRVQDALQHAPPHSDVEMGGESVALFGDRGAILGLREASGAPFALWGAPPSSWEKTPEEQIDGVKPLVAFPRWVKGAGTFDEVACRSVTPSEEFLAEPRTKHALAAIETVLGSLQNAGPIQQAFRSLTWRPSQILSSIAMAPPQRSQATMVDLVSPAHTLSTMLAIAGIVGVLSGTASAAVVLAMSKSSVYSSGRVALISDDA